MGRPEDAANTRTGSTCNPIPTLDYVKQLPGSVPAVERPPSPIGYVGPIIPKRSNLPLPSGPRDATYYFPIPLAKCPPTGIFFPAGSFPPSAAAAPVSGSIDVILYFHGFKLGEFQYVNEYWNGNLHNIRLREDVNSTTHRRPVLIAPTLGEYPGSASRPDDMGIFGRPGGADTFLAEVFRWVRNFVPEFSGRCLTPTIRSLVLAGHSGAGVILLNQAFSMRAAIDEVWGFDSLYGGDDLAADWFSLIQLRKDTKFFLHYGTRDVSVCAKKLDQLVKQEGVKNAVVSETLAPPGIAPNSGEHHFAVVTENFRTRVQNAACLS